MKKFIFALILTVTAASAAYASCGEDDAAQSLRYYAKTHWGVTCHANAKYIQTDNDKNDIFQVVLQNCVPKQSFGGIFWVVLREVNDGNCVMVTPLKRIGPQ